MNIIHRNHNWFLFAQNNTTYIQSKEPSASKLRCFVGRKHPNMLTILRKANHSGLYECEAIQSNWMNLWNEVSEGDKEWLLYEYIRFCQRCDCVPSMEHIWYASDRMVHTDWDSVKQKMTKKNRWKLFKKQVYTLQISKVFPYESAPWSIRTFISDIEASASSDFIQISEHPWFIRQSHRNKDSVLFSLPPPMDSQSEPPSSRKHSLDDFSLHESSAPNTFPVVRGSMIRSPTIQTFENHLNSQRPKKTNSLVHRIIRISSSLLK